MPDSYTAKLNLTKPEVGASTDTWGTKVNGDLDSIDALFETGPYLKIANGGTAAGTAANARTNLAVPGTAVSNTFTANQIISVTDNTNAALRITQLGTGEAIRVEDSTNPDSTPFIVNASGNVGVGTASPDALLSVSGVASFGAGSAAAPSIAGFGDLNTGVFFPAADTVAVAANGSEKFRIGSNGQLGIGGATYGTSGQVLTSAGSSAAPTWSDKTTRATSIATTSGTAHDFSSIPSGVKRITLMISGVSTNGTGNVILQLGSSGTPQATGYLGTYAEWQNGGNAGLSNFSTSFTITGTSGSSTTRHGTITLTNLSGNIWTMTSIVTRSDSTFFYSSSGSVTLSGTLDILRLSSTSTFDAGNINIIYE